MSTHQNTTSSDEIDLRELACTLWQRKGLIIGITVIITALAAAYAYTATPVYQTSVSLLPPPASALIEFNARAQHTGMAPGTWSAQPQQNSSLGSILTSSDAANLYFSYLSSSTIKTKFLADLVQQQGSATATPSIKTSLDKTTGKITLTLQSSQPQNLLTWSEQYLQLATLATQEELNAGINAASKALQEQLRQDLVIAQAVADAGKASDQTAQQPAEVVALQARLAQLQDNPPTALSVPLYVMDAPAATPASPIKPKKKLLIALGVVLGGMLGSFLVLLQHTFRRSGTN